ncbi:hypothetical protein GOODEAATRI_012612, partial [Goodea atripinnis]
VAVYVPGSKGAPSFVRLYQYPVLGGASAALANKSFFKADRVNMQWNQKAKNGPIYDVAWSPNSTEFCVVYGFMPAKATVFNLKCDPVFDFGTGPRNAAYYSPQGHILVLAGFGNLRGQMEVWDLKKYKQVSKPQAPDATYFSWCPDGEHIVTATCSPRLRVSNGYKIWHYTGTVLHKQDAAAGSELWKVHWQPFPEGSFPERPIKYQAAPSELGTTEAAPIQAYRPPALRHLPATPSSKLEAKSDPEPACLPAPVSNSQSEACSGDAETDKKIKNLKKHEVPVPGVVAQNEDLTVVYSWRSLRQVVQHRKHLQVRKQLVSDWLTGCNILSSTRTWNRPALLCDSAPLLWRFQDLKTVRSNSLVGALLGSLPRTPRQNIRLGRPLLLMPEEERVLREHHGAAALSARNQVRNRAGSESGAGSDEALQCRLLALEQNFSFPRSALAVQLSTARAGLSHCQETRAFLEADWPIREQDSPRRDARYQVFRDLWRRGFFLTSAGKFGGDFLVYPGDPLRFHAHFIAVCLTLDESICMLDVLSVARLGSNVKKTVLLCSPAPDGSVHYTSLQWSGMM